MSEEEEPEMTEFERELRRKGDRVLLLIIRATGLVVLGMVVLGYILSRI